MHHQFIRPFQRNTCTCCITTNIQGTKMDLLPWRPILGMQNSPTQASNWPWPSQSNSLPHDLIYKNSIKHLYHLSHSAISRGSLYDIPGLQLVIFENINAFSIIPHLPNRRETHTKSISTWICYHQNHTCGQWATFSNVHLYNK